MLSEINNPIIKQYLTNKSFFDEILFTLELNLQVVLETQEYTKSYVLFKEFKSDLVMDIKTLITIDYHNQFLELFVGILKEQSRIVVIK